MAQVAWGKELAGDVGSMVGTTEVFIAAVGNDDDILEAGTEAVEGKLAYL